MPLGLLPPPRPARTPQECLEIFEEGYKAHTSAVSSTGIGLHTTAKALDAAGGTALMEVELNARDGPHTVLHLFLPAECLPELPTPTGAATGDMGLAAMAPVVAAQTSTAGTSSDPPPSTSPETETLLVDRIIAQHSLDESLSERAHTDIKNLVAEPELLKAAQPPPGFYHCTGRSSRAVGAIATERSYPPSVSMGGRSCRVASAVTSAVIPTEMEPRPHTTSRQTVAHAWSATLRSKAIRERSLMVCVGAAPCC